MSDQRGKRAWGAFKDSQAEQKAEAKAYKDKRKADTAGMSFAEKMKFDAEQLVPDRVEPPKVQMADGAIWDPAATIEGIATAKLVSRVGVKKELRTLPHHLFEGEEVLNLSSGTYDAKTGLVVLTDRRVIFISAGIGHSAFEDFAYSKISSVQHSTSIMFGELTIFVSGNKAELKNMVKGRAKEIAEYIRRRITEPGGGAAQASTPAPDSVTMSVADELKKLADLKDAGVLTEGEFAAQKARLLG